VPRELLLPGLVLGASSAEFAGGGLIEAAFAHRRKTLANSLSLAGFAPREQAVAALGAIGRESNVRAEALSPAEFPALAEALR